MILEVGQLKGEEFSFGDLNFGHRTTDRVIYI